MPRMVNDERVTAQRLRELFDYDPQTGVFVRIAKPKRGKARWSGVAGNLLLNGYRAINIDGVKCFAHRLAWLYVHGEWPTRWVVHVNGDLDDNRIENLVLKDRPKYLSEKPLTQKRLREALDYDPDTGIFRWKVRSARAMPGDVAGARSTNGYRYMAIDAKRYLAHRLAWFHAYGRWPKHQIDHINGDPSDNRLANLREATPAENRRNSKLAKQNSTGFRGVNRVGNRFRATIVVGYQIIPLGRFDTAEEAHAAYCEAAKRYHGDFARDA